MTLKVLSWNIWYLGNLNLVNEFLERSNADIIALQEVMRSAGGLQISKKFTDVLGYRFIYAPVLRKEINGKNIEVGNAILAKHSILKSQVHRLSADNMRLAVQADIKVQNSILHVFSTHLFHNHMLQSDLQDEQARNLAKDLPKNNTIVMGDFNALPQSNPVKMMSNILQNTDDKLLPTWSLYSEGCCKSTGINKKIDYIFISRNLKSTNFTVEDSKASDHLPISAMIEI